VLFFLFTYCHCIVLYLLCTSTVSRRIRLPKKINFDLPSNLLIFALPEDFRVWCILRFRGGAFGRPCKCVSVFYIETMEAIDIVSDYPANLRCRQNARGEMQQLRGEGGGDRTVDDVSSTLTAGGSGLGLGRPSFSGGTHHKRAVCLVPPTASKLSSTWRLKSDRPRARSVVQQRQVDWMIRAAWSVSVH